MRTGTFYPHPKFSGTMMSTMKPQCLAVMQPHPAVQLLLQSRRPPISSPRLSLASLLLIMLLALNVPIASPNHWQGLPTQTTWRRVHSLLPPTSIRPALLMMNSNLDASKRLLRSARRSLTMICQPPPVCAAQAMGAPWVRWVSAEGSERIPCLGGITLICLNCLSRKPRWFLNLLARCGREAQEMRKRWKSGKSESWKVRKSESWKVGKSETERKRLL